MSDSVTLLLCYSGLTWAAWRGVCSRITYNHIPAVHRLEMYSPSQHLEFVSIARADTILLFE